MSGTIHHPHSQIVDLNYDYHDDIKLYHLQGTPIIEEDGIEINLSTRPTGFYEVNLYSGNKEKLPEFVRYRKPEPPTISFTILCGATKL